jgi:LysM repeat protein
MRTWSRLTLFILLNIVISACTAFAILFVWDRTRAPLPGGVIPPLSQIFNRPEVATQTPTVANTSVPAFTPTPDFRVHQVVEGETFESIAQEYEVSVEEILEANGFNQNQLLGIGEVLRIPRRLVTIDSVVGSGDLASEKVVLRSAVDQVVSLAGWRLEDQTGNSFTLPQVSIFSEGGQINLHTRQGTNTATDLYWGLSQPVWQSGALVALRDAANELRATYVIP